MSSTRRPKRCAVERCRPTCSAITFLAATTSTVRTSTTDLGSRHPADRGFGRLLRRPDLGRLFLLVTTSMIVGGVRVGTGGVTTSDSSGRDDVGVFCLPLPRRHQQPCQISACSDRTVRYLWSPSCWSELHPCSRPCRVLRCGWSADFNESRDVGVEGLRLSRNLRLRCVVRGIRIRRGARTCVLGRCGRCRF